ncbi:MAG: hypothetical protein V4671_17310 [Armatimonadota bacterium]
MNVRLRGSQRVTAAFFALFSLLMLAGCKGTSVEQISRILADPSAFSQKDVNVAGRVTRVLDPSAGLLNLAAYQVEDKSGRIWVISRSGAPSVGSEVGLKGRIRRDASLGGELFGSVLNEIERRTR